MPNVRVKNVDTKTFNKINNFIKERKINMRTRKTNYNPNANKQTVPQTPENTMVELKDGTVITLAMYYQLLDEIKA